jgi:hypothetical protein
VRTTSLQQQQQLVPCLAFLACLQPDESHNVWLLLIYCFNMCRCKCRRPLPLSTLQSASLSVPCFRQLPDAGSRNNRCEA